MFADGRKMRFKIEKGQMQSGRYLSLLILATECYHGLLVKKIMFPCSIYRRSAVNGKKEKKQT